MDINRFIKDNKDEHGYVELPSINNLISLLARTYCTKKEINDVLSALLSNNNNTIYAVQKCKIISCIFMVFIVKYDLNKKRNKSKRGGLRK